jgi:hypothetical protein
MSDLQFDRAESRAPEGVSICALCRTPLTSIFHVARNARFCGACRSAVEAEAGRRVAGGSLAMAAICGLGAAALTDGLYIFLLKGQVGIGLVAIFAGMIAGYAVRKGSGNRGGRACQILATALTLLTVAVAFLVYPPRSGMGLLWPVVMTGFALVEAWGINNTPRLVFHGPYEGGKGLHG